MNNALIEQRKTLTRRLAACERGAFPGSREWQEESNAIKALADFDAAYPEVLAEIRAAEQQTPATQRAMRMED